MIYDYVILYAAFVLGFIIPLQLICATQLCEPKKDKNILSELPQCDDYNLFNWICNLSFVINFILIILIVFFLYNKGKTGNTKYIDEEGVVYTTIPDGYYVIPESGDLKFDIID